MFSLVDDGTLLGELSPHELLAIGESWAAQTRSSTSEVGLDDCLLQFHDDHDADDHDADDYDAGDHDADDHDADDHDADDHDADGVTGVVPCAHPESPEPRPELDTTAVGDPVFEAEMNDRGARSSTIFRDAAASARKQRQLFRAGWLVTFIGESSHWRCKLTLSKGKLNLVGLEEHQHTHEHQHRCMRQASLSEVLWDNNGTGLFRLVFGRDPLEAELVWTLHGSLSAFSEIVHALRLSDGTPEKEEDRGIDEAGGHATKQQRSNLVITSSRWHTALTGQDAMSLALANLLV